MESSELMQCISTVAESTKLNVLKENGSWFTDIQG